MFSQSDVLDNYDNSFSGKHIDIRLVQRNGKKCTTTVEGLPDSDQLKELLSEYKKKYGCSGAIKEDDQSKQKVIVFTGNQTDRFKDFLVSKGLCRDSEVKVHGMV